MRYTRCKDIEKTLEHYARYRACRKYIYEYDDADCDYMIYEKDNNTSPASVIRRVVLFTSVGWYELVSMENTSATMTFKVFQKHTLVHDYEIQQIENN